jgi:hypothetical protein
LAGWSFKMTCLSRERAVPHPGSDCVKVLKRNGLRQKSAHTTDNAGN